MIKRLFDRGLMLWDNYQKLRFLIVGGINTVFNYFVTVMLYYLLNHSFNTAAIGVIANIISITEGFVLHKLLVFRSRGNWLKEYFKGFIVYAVITAIYATGLWFFRDIIGISIWIAPVVMSVICCIFSYIGLRVFTFKIKGVGNNAKNVFLIMIGWERFIKGGNLFHYYIKNLF